MTAAMLVLEPIFEADLPPEIYAYRAGRNAQQAVIDVEEQLFRGRPDVVDADLADYFGSIPHLDLMKSLARRIVDPRVLHLIRLWLDCAVEETDDKGRKIRTTKGRDQRRGIPQGSPISPLLANIYMRRFVLGWRKLGLGKRLGSRLITYADDLVILCEKGNAEAALDHTCRSGCRQGNRRTPSSGRLARMLHCPTASAPCGTIPRQDRNGHRSTASAYRPGASRFADAGPARGVHSVDRRAAQCRRRHR